MLPWWKTAVAYQIYPRSFADTDGDGIGDLEGVRRHLDHLRWLGVDAVWLSPFYPSPMADFGYDVSDYCDVDPLFGTLEQFDELVRDAHARDLRVIVDWVPNHTSEAHPWFRESRASRDNPKADWYIWRDPAPGGGPPNNWIRAWSDQPAWTFDETRGQYYLHCFLAEQPDLNWASAEVQRAMHDTLRFWLDRGVDGFRMDVIHLIGKDPALPDDPADLAALSHVPLNHRPETHALLRDIRVLLDSYDGDRMAVGEVYLLDTADVATYYGHDDELHLNFNFPPLYAPWDAHSWHKQIARAERELGPLGAWPTWVLSNHDNRRHATRYGADDARSRAAAVLLLTLRGTPFLYAGEELGLEDGVIPPERVVDPGGRDGCRSPIPWDATPTHGWGTDDPWLPWPPDADTRNAEVQLHDPESIANLYRRLLLARAGSPALTHGSIELLDAPEGVLAYRRRAEPTADDNADDTADERTVVINFTAVPVEIDPALASGTIALSTTLDREGQPFGGTLGADEALVLIA